MSLPLVAVVGRPNVGKSTFFNKIIGARIAIVEDTPGVTRDRIYGETDWNGRRFALIDTGGIDPDTEDVIMSQMREQAQVAMDMADVIVFMVDTKEGLTSSDTEVASMLRRTRRKVILVVNKADGQQTPETFYDFYELGIGEPMAISAANMTGLGDVLDEIVNNIPESDLDEDEDDETVRIAIIGKPNVGKSSLLNAIVGENRMIVSEIAGTTRDSVDTPFEYNGERYILVDTAGLRRRSKVSETIEHFSVLRAIAAIERSDICLLMIDAIEGGMTEQDKKIAGIAHEAGKGIVLVVNKWDLIEKETGTLEEFKKKIEKDVPFMSYAPIVFISVLTGQRLTNVLDLAVLVSENRSMRIQTGQLNALIQDAMLMHAPPSDKGKRLKIYYVSQIGIRPPLFSFKINNRDLMHFSYSRYLENKIRDTYGFIGTSVKFVFREKKDDL
jgi:GTP-binding protein